MNKWVSIFVPMLFLTTITFSEDKNAIVGWHWYNEPIKQQFKKRRNDELIKAFNQLTPLEQLKILQMATNNLRAKAVLSGKVRDITDYKKAQDFWIFRATQFTIGWERMLLEHPELNYSLNFSHENSLAPILQQAKHEREKQTIFSLAQTHGLLFFFRGKNKGDQLFSKIVSHYSSQYHLVVIPIAVDGVISTAFNNNQQSQGLQKAHMLGIYYFPALVLVNPANNRHEVISYGFKSENEISDRLLKIANNWKAEF